MANRPARGGRAAQAPAPAWIPKAVAAAAILVGLVAVYFSLPGALVIWLGLVVGSWSAVMPLITGKDPQTKNPIPQGPGEQALYQRFQFWRALKWNLLLPVSAFAPGWPVRASFLGGLLAAGVAFCLPSIDLPAQYPSALLPSVNALFAFVTVSQVCAARRDTVMPGDRSPGVRVDSLRKIGATPRTRTVVMAAAATAAAAGAGAATLLMPAPRGHFTLLPDFATGLAEATAWPVLGAALGFAAVVARPWVDTALGHWREVCAAREEWKPRWTMLKHNFPPRLNDRQKTGAAVVDTFTSDGAMGGSATYLALGQKITPTMGRPVRIAVLPVEMRDSAGQPMPGTIDANDFQIVTWPSDFSLSLADPTVDPDLAHLWLSCSLAWVCEGLYDPPIIDQMVPLAVAADPEPTYLTDPETGQVILNEETGEPTPDPSAASPSTEPEAQAWAVTLHMPRGPGYESVRRDLVGPLTGYVGAEALADHRNGGALYIGALTEGTPPLDPNSGVTAEHLHNLDTEDAWNARWAAVLKQDVNPPTIEHRTYGEQTLASGAVVMRQAFVPRQGVDLRDFFNLEPKIAATFSGAPFVSVTGWTTQDRVGERHAQAFAVHWSSTAVPSNPDTLKPLAAPARPGRRRTRSDANPRDINPRDPRSTRSVGDQTEMPSHNEAYLWVLSGRMNQAFKAARLAQPETYAVRCLTTPSSPGHIWQISLRLYDGVTLAEVRGMAQKLRQNLASQWLRVEAAPDGCVIVVGADPKRVRLAAPERDARYLASLNWEQAWLDSKVSGVGGLTPSLVDIDHLPKNDKVEVLTFNLPSGLSLPDIQAATKKLETATANAFILPRRTREGRPDQIEILACEVNPLPESSPFDWDEADTGDHRIPFATNLSGEATSYNNRDDAHLLISGTSGGGKSVALQNFVYGAAIRGWDLYVIDPSKGAVDFNFVEPYTRAVARSVWEAKGVIEAIYAEVTRRKAINGAHNCGNYRDLPEDVRYPHVLVVMDEFTSLMMPEQAPKPMSDDPGVLAEHAKVVAMNACRAYIGTYVGKIVREARSTGFTMLMATQALKAETLSKIPGANDLKDNMSRMIVGRASIGQLQAALKMPFEAPPQPDVLPAGRGLYEGNGRPAEVIQVWFEPSQAVFADRVGEYRDPIPSADRLDLSAFVEPEIEIDGGVIGPGPDPLAAAPAEYAPSLADIEEVIELDELTVSLDDLTGFLADGDPEQAPAPEQEALAPDRADADFDWDALQASATQEANLQSPQTSDWSSPEPTEPTVEAGPPSGQEDPAAQTPVDGVILGASVAWDEIDPSAWEPEQSDYGWTEIDALAAFLTQYPQVETVSWLAPRLHDLDATGVPFIDFVRDIAEEHGVIVIGPPVPASTHQEPVATEAPSHPLPLSEEHEPMPTQQPTTPAVVSAPSAALDEFDNVPRVPMHLIDVTDQFA
ncbi:FtsK/SpoIIIE domain-containing protein [Nocardioides sp. Leaf285]|uniref:FtsK/SpoIIIE domain-containing protein n=1 Tax=Nocardioides sp. Leaf285 TaxID=1736322 RepID=UPI000702EE3C|nr:FtsK/SpoIIIE domain-containing protein [Nocardioides sp. Leaf285]KQP63078.1 hypothetical protein ASF47_18885 [Nocardioides sp. Leaf285]